MSLDSLWLAVDLDVLAMGTAALFFITSCWCCFVAQDFANEIYAAGSTVEPFALGDAASPSAGGWAAGPVGVPQPPTPGSPAP